MWKVVEVALFSNERHYETWFPKKRTITFFWSKLSKLHKKEPILHVATTFSLKQGETRANHGPIPHPLMQEFSIDAITLSDTSQKSIREETPSESCLHVNWKKNGVQFSPNIAQGIKRRLQNPTAGWPAVPSGSGRFLSFWTMATARNRAEPLVNRRLGFEAAPKTFYDTSQGIWWLIHTSCSLGIFTGIKYTILITTNNQFWHVFTIAFYKSF